MKVRLATKIDLPSLVRLNDQIQFQHANQYSNVFNYPVDAVEVSKFFERLIENKSNHVLVAFDEKGIRGYLYYENQSFPGNIFKAQSTRYYIHHVMVDPEVRRTGVASALFENVEISARADGVSSIFLDTMELNETAQQFFQNKGYKTSARIFSKNIKELPV